MTKRARSISVLLILIGGVWGLISSTQNWLDATVSTGTTDTLHVPGGTVVAVLAPLSLAAMAAAIALSIVGRALRYGIGLVAVVIAIAMIVINARVLVAPEPADVAAAVTEATGLAGEQTVASLVTDLAQTPWVALTLVAWIIMATGGVLTLATAHGWSTSGRRYAANKTQATTSGPLDSIDSWDDLSRGDDPTQGA